MSGPRHVLSRRALLRGAGGVLVGLPMLEAMLPRVALAAPAANVPRRMIVSYAGTTHGSSKTLNPAAGALPTTFSPQCAALAPVRSLVSMVSGLAIPSYNSGTPSIPGGAYNMQHGGVMAPMLSGMRSLEHMAVMPFGHTVDQHVADAIGSGTRLASVQASIQAAGYGGGSGKGIQSARIDAGKLRGLPPITSPSLLFSTLFGAAPGGGGAASASNAAKDRSILDYVLADASRLQQRVSTADRARLDQHFTELRALEQRLGTVPPVTASCTTPVAPGADPAPGAATFGGWSNETLRGDLMADMLALALACDVTRAVSLMVSWDQSFLRTQDPAGTYADMHATGHRGTQDQIAYNANWHVGRFAKVVKKLSETPDAGGTLLDSTFVVMIFAEGSNSHNKGDITAFCAGIPSKLKMGQHIPTGGAHPAKLMVSGMQAMGLPATSLGEVTGNLPALML